MNNKRYTSKEELEELDKVLQLIRYGTLSLRVGASLLKARTGKGISHEGLRKIMNEPARESEAEVGDESRGIPD